MKRTATVLGIAAALAVPSVASAGNITTQIANPQLARTQIANAQVAKTQRVTVARYTVARYTVARAIGYRIALWQPAR